MAPNPMGTDPRQRQVASLGVPVGLESQENRILEQEGSLEMTALHRLGDTEKRACLGLGAVGRAALEPGRGCPARGCTGFFSLVLRGQHGGTALLCTWVTR